MNYDTRDLWNLGPGVMARLFRSPLMGQEPATPPMGPDARMAWLAEYQKAAAAPDVRKVGPANAGVAVIRIAGPVVGDSAWWYEGRMALTHATVAAAISAAAADPTVVKIALELDCPGWNAGDSDRTIDALENASRVKPVVARVTGAALSGGAWIAAMCSEVSAARESWHGSIGAMIVQYDDSARFRREGIEANVFAFPSVDKAAGVPGVPLTEASRANLQAIVDAHGKRFAAAVAKGRGVSEESVVAMNAAVMTAEAAKAAGLIDVIESQEAWESRVSAASKGAKAPAPTVPSAPTGPSSRAKENPVDFSKLTAEEIRQHAPALARELEEAGAKAAGEAAVKAAGAPATLAQLKEIHGDDAASIVASQEKGHTPVQAMAARNAALAARVAEQAAEIVSLREQAGKTGKEHSGTDAVSAGGRPVATNFSDVVKSVQAADGVSRPVAMYRAAQKSPGAYRAWKAEGCPAIG